MKNSRTIGFVDSAAIHSAFGVLVRGSKVEHEEWNANSILEVTYLLMQDGVSIAPGREHFQGTAGYLKDLVVQIPAIQVRGLETSHAEATFQRWARNKTSLKKAWDKLNLNPEYRPWHELQRDLFLTVHIQMYGALFDRSLIPVFAPIIDCSEDDLRKAWDLGRKVETVQKWIKNGFRSEDAKLAIKGWLISSLSRGRYHCYMAQDNGMHLIAHPSRDVLQPKVLKAEQPQCIHQSEELFTRIIIGSALLEKRSQERVKAWIHYLETGRKGIRTGGIVLPPTTAFGDAVDHAVNAAKKCAIHGSSERLGKAIDLTGKICLGLFLSYAVKPWAPIVGPVTVALVHALTGNGIGESVRRLLTDTERRYRRLSESKPGKVTRKIRIPGRYDRT